MDTGDCGRLSLLAEMGGDVSGAESLGIKDVSATDERFLFIKDSGFAASGALSACDCLEVLAPAVGVGERGSRDGALSGIFSEIFSGARGGDGSKGEGKFWITLKRSLLVYFAALCIMGTW